MKGSQAGLGATRTDVLYQRLRDDVLSGVYAPGERLPFAELVDRYDVSIGSLREALQRLVEAGLAVSVAQQGFRVIPLSVDDLQDLTVARLEIEVAALRHAVWDGDMGWESRVVAAHHVLERTPNVDEPGSDRFSGSWSVAHADFHEALTSGCANRRLRAVAESLRAVAELYRGWSLRFAPHRGRDTADEHRAIMDAALDRDADLAASLLRKHIELTTYNLAAVLERELGALE